MDAAEYSDWLAYAARYGLPHRNVSIMLGQLCVLLYNVHRAKGALPSKLGDFLKGE